MLTLSGTREVDLHSTTTTTTKVAAAVDASALAFGGLTAMSLSPKHAHSTPFSVTDILSPLEHEYKKTIEAAIPPLTPYRSAGGQHHHQSMSAMGGMGGMSVPVTNPYYNVPQLTHHTAGFPAAQYCNGSELGYDPTGRSSAGWYSSNPDPRFACEYGNARLIFLFRKNCPR